MTQHSLTTIIEVAVPVAAMSDAIILAHRLGEDVRSTRLLNVARAHGGDALLAQAIELRLRLLAMLLSIDPCIGSLTANLAPTQIAEVLVSIPVQVRTGKLEFDADTLVAALRFVAEPQGTA